MGPRGKRKVGFGSQANRSNFGESVRVGHWQLMLPKAKGLSYLMHHIQTLSTKGGGEHNRAGDQKTERQNLVMAPGMSSTGIRGLAKSYPADPSGFTRFSMT